MAVKVTKVIINRGATVNIGNYESARVDITQEGVPTDGETLEEIAAVLNDTARNWLAVEVAAIQEEAHVKPLPTSRFTG